MATEKFNENKSAYINPAVRVIGFSDGTQGLYRDSLLTIPINSSPRTHTVCVDDTLTSISYLVYGSPMQWFIIAEANDIINPFELELGKKLIIPELTEIIL